MFYFDFKGIDIGDDRVKNWLVSLTISSLFGFLVTLPIQVILKNICCIMLVKITNFSFYNKIILMTTIFACICGKYDESQDLENDSKDKHGPLNKKVIFIANFFLSSFLVFKFFIYLRINSPSITYRHLKTRNFTQN